MCRSGYRGAINLFAKIFQWQQPFYIKGSKVKRSEEKEPGAKQRRRILQTPRLSADFAN